MRIRSFIAGLAAIASVFTAAQPQAIAATTNATVTINFHVNCFGCGPSSASSSGTCNGVCYWNGHLCIGSCTFTNSETVNSPVSTCPVTVAMSGTISTSWAGSSSFTLTAVSGTAVISMSGGATGVGYLVVTSPVGNPCGGPADLLFVGHLAGA